MKSIKSNCHKTNKSKNKNIFLSVFLLGFILFAGCTENYQNPYAYYESPWNSRELNAAIDQAKINEINQRNELEKSEHAILLLASEKNIRLMPDVDIKAINYSVVNKLIKKLKRQLSKDSPVLVASLVNLDNLEKSSTFGRVVSEQISSRFKQHRYTTIEIKLRTSVFIKKKSGEFLLSRELSDIGLQLNAQAVVVGTYAIASDRVYLTIRVVDFTDGRILASYDYTIPISRDVFKMLLKDDENIDWL